jgi:hypothetical protein
MASSVSLTAADTVAVSAPKNAQFTFPILYLDFFYEFLCKLSGFIGVHPLTFVLHCDLGLKISRLLYLAEHVTAWHLQLRAVPEDLAGCNSI